MPAVVLDILKYLFLFLIFLFLARAVRAMYLEIAGPKAVRSQNRPAKASRPGKATRPPDRIAVTAPDEKPRMFDVTDELIVGRAAKCQIVITDAYASQVHARIFRKDGQIFIEDMGSTNGTYLNDKKVKTTLPVNRGDRAKIGKTEMEFRR